MDESYLTGEPYVLSKAPGVGRPVRRDQRRRRARRSAPSARRSIRATPRSCRSCASRSSAGRDCGGSATRLGAFYTPLAVAIALAAWAWSGEARRFLAVLVVATPCPLLIAIPVAIIGSVSLAARRGIIIKDPAVLERLDTLPHGDLRQDRHAHLRPAQADGGAARRRVSSRSEVLGAGRQPGAYSSHPLAPAILDGAREARAGARRGRGSQRAARRRAARHDRRPGRAGHQPQDSSSRDSPHARGPDAAAG